ncbi:efflux RND transporter periplasmic adaptor subunit [Ferruginibacter sp.]|nr:efflux RND transporter periplasmic adaptor subunit [Ferruginibacter sp.]
MSIQVVKLKSAIVYVFILLAFFTSSCQSGKEDSKAAAPKAPPPPTMADGFVVTPQLLSQEIEVPGSLAAYEETEIRPEVSGRVTGVYFKEGSNVAQGSVLLRIYDADLQAQLQKLDVQLKTAEQTAERYNALLKINGVSQQEYDISVLNANNIKADMNIIRTNIARTTVRAPFSGKLGITTITKGAYVTSQTIIASLRKVSQLKLDFTVPEVYGSKMKNGTLVHFTVEGSGNNYPATISATENIIAEDNRSLRVIATVTKPDGQLIAGAFAKVKIALGENNAALMIPTQSVIPDARNKKVIAVRNGIAAMEIVTLGARDSAMVEVTSGLKAGDTILVTGLLTTRPGSNVQLNKISKN